MGMASCQITLSVLCLGKMRSGWNFAPDYSKEWFSLCSLLNYGLMEKCMEMLKGKKQKWNKWKARDSQRLNPVSIKAAKILLTAVVQNQNKIGGGRKQGKEEEIREGWLQMVWFPWSHPFSPQPPLVSTSYSSSLFSLLKQWAVISYLVSPIHPSACLG